MKMLVKIIVNEGISIVFYANQEIEIPEWALIRLKLKWILIST